MAKWTWQDKHRPQSTYYVWHQQSVLAAHALNETKRANEASVSALAPPNVMHMDQMHQAKNLSTLPDTVSPPSHFIASPCWILATSQSSRDEVELRSFYQMTTAIRDRRFKECSLLLHSCFLFQAGVLGEARAHVFRLSAHIHSHTHTHTHTHMVQAGKPLYERWDFEIGRVERH